MNTNKPTDYVAWLQASMRSLSLSPAYGSNDAVYREIANRSGVSKSAVMKLFSGESANPKVGTADKLVDAVRSMFRDLGT